MTADGVTWILAVVVLLLGLAASAKGPHDDETGRHWP